MVGDAKILSNLARVIHAGKEETDAGLVPDVAQRPLRGAPPLGPLIEDRLQLRRQILRESSSLQRLHDDDTNPFRRRVAKPVGAGLEVGVHVVVLNLCHGPPVVLVDNPGELVLLSVKGERGMTDAAASALRVEELAHSQAAHSVPRLPIEAVDEVEVDMVGLKPLELPREVAFHFI